MFESGLRMFMLESALALLAFIVWWTLPRKKRPSESRKDSKHWAGTERGLVLPSIFS